MKNFRKQNEMLISKPSPKSKNCRRLKDGWREIKMVVCMYFMIFIHAVLRMSG